MWKPPVLDKALPYALLGMTAVTGVVDAVSFLFLGHVFTANMTGNVVLLAFASTGVPEVSVARSLTALCAFLVGAAVGGRILADVPLENLEMSERKGIIFPLQFMGNAIPPTEPRGSNSWGPSLMPVNTIGLMQASQRSRDRTQIAKGQSER